MFRMQVLTTGLENDPSCMFINVYTTFHQIYNSTACKMCYCFTYQNKKKKKTLLGKRKAKQNSDNTLYVLDKGYFQVRKAWCRTLYIAYHPSGQKKIGEKDCKYTCSICMYSICIEYLCTKCNISLF